MGTWWVEYWINPGVRVCWYVAAPDEWTAVEIAANRSAEVLGYRPDPSTLYRVVSRRSD
jgi:hypothetical protein